MSPLQYSTAADKHKTNQIHFQQTKHTEEKEPLVAYILSGARADIITMDLHANIPICTQVRIFFLYTVHTQIFRWTMARRGSCPAWASVVWGEGARGRDQMTARAVVAV